MKRKTIHFLSGLPRTGSTLLGSILAQNPAVHVTPTSPLYSLLVNTNEHFNLLAEQYTFDHAVVGSRVYRAMIDAFYADIGEKIIFDKHRGWPKNIEAICEYLNPNPRLVCTVRPIAEIIASYITLAERDPDNFIDRDIRAAGVDVTNEARAHLLWTTYLKIPYESLLTGLASHRSLIILVDYRDIVFHPEQTLRRICEFCELDEFGHTFKQIENRCAEAKDETWGMRDLHTIRTRLTVESVDPREYLPGAAIEYFSQFDVRVPWLT